MAVLVPMDEAEYAAFVAAAVPAYAADKVASGQWPETGSVALAGQSFLELLPQGLATADNYLFSILAEDEQTRVGSLWMALQERAEARVAYVYAVSIEPDRRRRGHATRAFLALEDIVRGLGLSGIALHVFAHNAGARALYAKLGYRPADGQLFKPVYPADA
jgi:ribosomal protein S18 acetylase RimI-like enzyme